MHSAPSLPRTWLIHSRTFWLGGLDFAFFVWLTIDSHLNTSVIRTIYRGSWRDWSSDSSIPAGTPAESGSLMIELAGGTVGVNFLDQLKRNADYSGTDERGKAQPGFRKIWIPRIINERDSVMRIRGAHLPTWLLLALWLGIWLRQLVKSRCRHRSYLATEASPAS